MTSDTPSDNIHLINYFQQGLNPAIAKKIALSDNMPTTIAEWSDQAVQYDTNYRLTMAMLGRTAYGKSDCYDFKRFLRQLSTVIGSKFRVLMSLEECKS